MTLPKAREKRVRGLDSILRRRPARRHRAPVMGCVASHQGQAGDAGLLRPWNLGRELGVRKNRSKSREQLMDQVAMALGVYREGGYDASL